MGEELGGGKCAVVAAVVIGSPMPTASGDRARLLSAADAVSPISPRLWPVVCGEAMATAGLSDGCGVRRGCVPRGVPAGSHVRARGGSVGRRRGGEANFPEPRRGEGEGSRRGKAGPEVARRTERDIYRGRRVGKGLWARVSQRRNFAWADPESAAGCLRFLGMTNCGFSPLLPAEVAILRGAAAA